MDQLKMYSLLKMGIFHCYVSLLEGSCIHAFILFPGKDARVRPVSQTVGVSDDSFPGNPPDYTKFGLVTYHGSAGYAV